MKFKKTIQLEKVSGAKLNEPFGFMAKTDGESSLSESAWPLSFETIYYCKKKGDYGDGRNERE